MGRKKLRKIQNEQKVKPLKVQNTYLVNLGFESNKWIYILVIAFATVAISLFLYGNTLNGEFVYGDVFFSERKDLHNPSSLLKIWTQPYQPQNTETGGGFYRPVCVASLALNFILFGPDTFSFHLTNILLYAAVIFTLFLVLTNLFKNKSLAVLSTLFFAFLPIHSEVVANIKSRDEMLSTIFILISWLVFLKSKELGQTVKNLKVWISALLFFPAILSKESVILMPLLFIVVFAIKTRPSISEVIKISIPFAFFYTCYFPLRMIALGKYAYFADKSDFIMNQLSDVPFWTRISTSFYILFLYVLKTFIPFNLSASYDYAVIPTLNTPFSSSMAIFGILLAIIFAILIFLRPIPKPVRIGTIFFVIAYLVISKIFFAKGAIFGERLIFLSTVGLSIIAGWVLFKIYNINRYAVGVFFGITLIVYSIIVIQRNKVWLNEKVFFEQMVADSPNSVQARNGLAQGYFKLGQLNKAYEHALAGNKIYQKHPPLLNLLGKLEFIQGNYQKSYDYLKEAVRLNPKNFENHQFYNYSLIKLGRYSESISYIKSQLKEHPDDPELRFIMAANLYKMGNKKEALTDKYIWAKELSILEREQVLQEF